jgi:hypothetical protein
MTSDGRTRRTPRSHTRQGELAAGSAAHASARIPERGFHPRLDWVCWAPCGNAIAFAGLEVPSLVDRLRRGLPRYLLDFPSLGGSESEETAVEGILATCLPSGRHRELPSGGQSSPSNVATNSHPSQALADARYLRRAGSKGLTREPLRHQTGKHTFQSPPYEYSNG